MTCLGLLLLLVALVVFVVVVLEPAAAHLDSLVPLLEPLLGTLARNRGLENLAAGTVDLLKLGGIAPDTSSETGSNGSTESGGFAHGGAINGNTADVSLGLHGEVGVGETAIDSEELELAARVLLHGIKDGLGLEAGSLKSGASNVSLLSVLGDTDCRAHDRLAFDLIVERGRMNVTLG